MVGSQMILATVALGAALMYTREVMIPFVLALFIATMVSPIVDYLRDRLRFPHMLAVGGALLVVVGILVILGLFLVFAVHTIVAANASGQYARSFTGLASDGLKQLESLGVKMDQARIDGILKEIQAQLPGFLSRAAGTATSCITSGGLILIFVVFLLAGRKDRAAARGIHREIESAVRNYLTTKFVISLVTGILVWLILAAFGLPLASIFGILAFLLNFIPSIGSIISTLLPIPIAFAEYDSMWTIFLVVALPGSVHMLIGNVIEPKVMGQGLELHPVTILLALAFWGLLWGPIGMVLSVPIMASIRIIFLRFATTKPLGDLLAGYLPGEPSKDHTSAYPNSQRARVK